MDLIQIKQIIEAVSLQHIQVKSFAHGDSWESSVDGDENTKYPKIFFETPILGNITRTQKTYSFGLVCFVYPTELYTDQFGFVNESAKILDEIITKIDKDYKNQMAITFPYSTLSFNLDTTSLLTGTRADLQVTINSTCRIDDKFDVNKSFS